MSTDEFIEPCRPLRNALGRYATGVAIVTTCYRGRPAGLTVNSFTSLSLDPPLVSWCLRRSSASLPAFIGTGHFAVHVLGAEQRELAARFASPGDRFAQLAFHVDHFGLPLLDGAITTLRCLRNRTIAAGDHLLFVGQVLEHQVMPGAPLLFVDGTYHSGPSAGPHVKENSQSRLC